MDKAGKPVIKPKPSNLYSKFISNEDNLSCVQDKVKVFDQAPQPAPRKPKLKQHSIDIIPADNKCISNLQQTKPPVDLDTILTVTPKSAVLSFDNENTNVTTSGDHLYATIPRTIEKKIYFKNFSCCDEAPTDFGCDKDIPLAFSAPKVCWKSEEFLAIDPIASIDRLDFETDPSASLNNIASNQARIEPSPERFLDDILRKRKSIRSFPSPLKHPNKKNLEEIESALERNSELSNLIPMADDDSSDSDGEDGDDYEGSDSNDGEDNSTTSRKGLEPEYLNMRNARQPLITGDSPLYANLQLLDETTRKSMSLEDKEQIRRMNLFFGVKKDTKTDLETEVFNSIISGNALTTKVHTKSVQLQKGRRRLSHLRSNVKVTPTSFASGQLLHDLHRMKKWAVDKMPMIGKHKNRSTDDLLGISNGNLGSSGRSTSTRSSDWKQKFIKVMKKHFKVTGEEEESTVVVATFGVPLDMCPMSSNNKRVPAIVEFCITVIENLGLSSQGIFRIPGNNASVNALLSELNKDPDSITFENERWQDVNVIGSLLKLFFRKLPEPLIITGIYDEVIDAAKCMNREKKLLRLKLHLLDLPLSNRETFKYLANHLGRVAANQAENKMDAHNLAIMFGPSLVRPKNESTNQMLSDMKYQTDVVENIIKYCDWMFSEWTEDSNIPPDLGDHGYDQSSPGNLELLASTEALLSFKPLKDPEPESPDDSLSFLRQGFIRLSGRGKGRRKSGKSETPVQIIPNSEREVELKKVNLNNLSRLVDVWRSHALETMSTKSIPLKRNLTQRYASKQLEISAPLMATPTERVTDESKSEEDIFSSIKRYPAYSYRNTTIRGSSHQTKTKIRNPTNHTRVYVSHIGYNADSLSLEGYQPLTKFGGKVDEQCGSNKSHENFAFGQIEENVQSSRNYPTESESSDVSSSNIWTGRKESFVVRRPDGRSYFASSGDKFFSDHHHDQSKILLNRKQLIREIEMPITGETFVPRMTKLKQFVPHATADDKVGQEIPLCRVYCPSYQ